MNKHCDSFMSCYINIEGLGNNLCDELRFCFIVYIYMFAILCTRNQFSNSGIFITNTINYMAKDIYTYIQHTLYDSIKCFAS